jgi:alkylhydroperoxidase family enzyme
MRVDVPEGDEFVHPFAGLTQYTPEIAAAAMQFSSAVYQHSKLPVRVLEAARTRTAEINGCLVCQAFRSVRDLPVLYGDVSTMASNGPAPDNDLYLQVAEWRTSTLFDDREKLAIEYAEGMGLDPIGIAANEDFWARAKKLFTDAELADLTLSISSWVAVGRATHVLGLDTVCMVANLDQRAQV